MGICFCPGLYSGPFSFVTWVSSRFKPWVEGGWYTFWTAGSNYKGPTNKVLATHSMSKKGCIWKNNQHIETPHNYLKTISGVIVVLKCLTYTTMIFYIIRFFFQCFLILAGAPVWNPARCLDTYGVLEEFGVQLTADDFYQRCSVGWCNVGWKHDIYDRYMVIYVGYVAHTLTQIYNDTYKYIVLIQMNI